MIASPVTIEKVSTFNHMLWAIRSYLDLLSGPDRLVYGKGLARLYVISSAGMIDYSDNCVEAIANKAERLKILPFNLHGFMQQAIVNNCYLYGTILQDMIEQRFLSIANGDVRNPTPTIKYNPAEARRHFYLPPFTLVRDLQKAIAQDYGYDSNRTANPAVFKFEDLSATAVKILSDMRNTEGHISRNQTSFGALSKCVNELVCTLNIESNFPSDKQDYTRRARSCLTILWVIAKMMMGDLTMRPDRQDTNLIDLQDKFKISEGTLAAIPFPIKSAISVFGESDSQNNLSMKARTYLSAVSAAEFYRVAS